MSCAPTIYPTPAQQLRQQRGAQVGEGAGLVEVGVYAVEHRLNASRELGGYRIRRYRDLEGTDVAPVGAGHLRSGGGEVGELNQFVAARVTE
ncbi:MAG: hypothetical protein U0936_26220 [Planctomycetaceae bacterium]